MFDYTQQKFHLGTVWGQNVDGPGPPLELPLFGENCAYAARGIDAAAGELCRHRRLLSVCVQVTRVVKLPVIYVGGKLPVSYR